MTTPPTNCPICQTEMAHWTPVGYFCPNGDCDVVDDWLRYVEEGDEE